MYGVLNYIMFEQKLAVFTERLNFNKMRKYKSSPYDSNSMFLRLLAHFFFFPLLFFLLFSVFCLFSVFFFLFALPPSQHRNLYVNWQFYCRINFKISFFNRLVQFLVTFDIILQPHDSRVWQTSKLFKESRVWQKRGFEEAGKTVSR